MIDVTRQAVLKATEESRLRFQKCRRPAIVGFALKLVSKIPWCFTKTDKDGGFAAAPTPLLTFALDQTLSDQTKYRICSRNHISVDLVDEYKAVCEKVCEEEGSREKLEPSDAHEIIVQRPQLQPRFQSSCSNSVHSENPQG